MDEQIPEPAGVTNRALGTSGGNFDGFGESVQAGFGPPAHWNNNHHAQKRKARSFCNERAFLKVILAATYFPTSGPGSIIGDGGLNYRVRNGIGCTPSSGATRKFLMIFKSIREERVFV